MNGYFEPLRRKIGVLTLGLACLLMAVFLSKTSIELPSGRGAHQWIEAGDIVHEHWNNILVDPSGVIVRGPNEGKPYKEPSGTKVVNSSGHGRDTCTYSDRAMGFERRVHTSTTTPLVNNEKLEFIFCRTQSRISLLYAIEPLTLLSAWLLLSRPQVSEPQPPSV